MIKGCKIILNPTPKVIAIPVPAEPSTTFDPSTNANEPKGKKVKFSTEAEVAPPSTSERSTAVDAAEEARLELRKARARVLLDALQSQDD